MGCPPSRTRRSHALPGLPGRPPGPRPRPARSYFHSPSSRRLRATRIFSLIPLLWLAMRTTAPVGAPPARTAHPVHQPWETTLLADKQAGPALLSRAPRPRVSNSVVAVRLKVITRHRVSCRPFHLFSLLRPHRRRKAQRLRRRPRTCSDGHKDHVIPQAPTPDSDPRVQWHRMSRSRVQTPQILCE